MSIRIVKDFIEQESGLPIGATCNSGADCASNMCIGFYGKPCQNDCTGVCSLCDPTGIGGISISACNDSNKKCIKNPITDVWICIDKTYECSDSEVVVVNHAIYVIETSFNYYLGQIGNIFSTCPNIEYLTSVANNQLEQFKQNVQPCCENHDPTSIDVLECIESVKNDVIDTFISEFTSSCGKYSNILKGEMESVCEGAFNVFDAFRDDLESKWLPEGCRFKSVCETLAGRLEEDHIEWLDFLSEILQDWHQPSVSNFIVCDLYGYRANDALNDVGDLIDSYCSSCP